MQIKQYTVEFNCVKQYTVAYLIKFSRNEAGGYVIRAEKRGQKEKRKEKEKGDRKGDRKGDQREEKGTSVENRK